ncbi:MAG: lipase family protein [Opitutales bacterium]|nr:lipase family protein [Opitutales bacterium]
MGNLIKWVMLALCCLQTPCFGSFVLWKNLLESSPSSVFDEDSSPLFPEPERDSESIERFTLEEKEEPLVIAQTETVTSDTSAEEVSSSKQETHLSVAKWFQNIHPDIIQLIKRSYLLTKRDSQNCFVHEAEMLQGNPTFQTEKTQHSWHCFRNFTGIHGDIQESSCLGNCLNCFLKCFSCGRTRPELDFAGFVAYKPEELPGPNYCPYHVICVVFRGSQGESFQPGNGMMSASWATNYDCAPTAVNPESYGFEGRVHGGYLAKVNSCNFPHEDIAMMVCDGEIDNPLHDWDDRYLYSLDESIQEAIDRVPANERDKIRFIVTGHSQGGGLAQVALPYILTKFSSQIPGFQDNFTTPRFFGYFLSPPRVIADAACENAYNLLVGYDNMISHFAFRDIVTLASLRGYVPLGHLAIDAPYDVITRGIQSEIAYNNRLFLMEYLKAKLDSDRFDTSDAKCWIFNENPELLISWTDIGHILADIRQYFNRVLSPNDLYLNISPRTLLEIFNLALERYNNRKHRNSQARFESNQIVFHETIDWDMLRELGMGDLCAEEVVLDPQRQAIIDQLDKNITGETVTFSRRGNNNITALIDTVCDLRDAERGHSNPGGAWETIKRFICPCIWGELEQPEQPYIFDEEFKQLLEEHGIAPQDYGISPAGQVSLIAYLHYGSGANGYNAKLFDPYMPSANLNWALDNGWRIEHGDNRPWAECAGGYGNRPTPPPSAQSSEIDFECPRSVILHMAMNTSEEASSEEETE